MTAMNQIVRPARSARRVRDAMMFHAAPVALALEPRFMFDAAGAATGAEAVREATAEAIAAEYDAASGAVDSGDDAALAAASATHQLPLGDGAETAPAVAPESPRKEVIFIDASVDGYEALAATINDSAEVVILDADQDGLAQMAAWAEGRSGYDAIHVISHGSEGAVRLGGFILTSTEIDARTADLTTLGEALGENGDILLYGCTVGGDADGQQFLDRVAAATGADVAASHDLTGASQQGGDWDLEVATGPVEAETYAFSSYQGLLDLAGATASITIDGNSVDGIDPVTVGPGNEWDLTPGLNQILLDIDPDNETITFEVSNQNFEGVPTFEVSFSGGNFLRLDSVSATATAIGDVPDIGSYSASLTSSSQIKFWLPTGTPVFTGKVVFTYTSTAIPTNEDPSITGLPTDGDRD